MKKLIAVFGVLAALAFAVPAFAQYAPTYPYPTPTPSYACPQLTYNLYRGLNDYRTGGQVSQLQQFLSARGYSQLVTGYFGSMTYANVAQFQREQGVYPITGGVGPLTRAAIARVCGGVVYPPPVSGGISITNISGPNSVAVGQSATWSITTNAPYGSYLSTSVRWGDENLYGYPYGMAAASPVSQQTSFTHSYSQAGTYTITFTVTDNAGRIATANTTVVVGGTQNSSITFSANPTSGAPPLAVNFSAGGLTAGGSYYLNYGDGTNAQLSLISLPCYYGAVSCPSSANTSHTYTQVGTYIAQLTYQPSFYCPPGGMCPMMMPAPQIVGTVTVTVTGSTQNNTFTATPTSGVAPLAVAFFARASQTGSYTIDFGDGTNGIPSPAAGSCDGSTCAYGASHTYTQAGTYTGKLIYQPSYCLPSGVCPMLILVMQPAPQVVGTVTITVSGTGQYSINAYPTSGFTPLTVTFSVNNYSGQYAVDFGDGTSASQVTSSISHTYYNHGVYTAQFQSDPACRHTTPQCMIATLNLGSVTITALTATL